MFLIIANGIVRGMCDVPRYVKNHNGTWVQCKKNDHEAIAIGGTAYRDAIAKEQDGGEYVFPIQIKLSEVSTELEDTEDATCDLSEELDERITDIENALCELTEE